MSVDLQQDYFTLFGLPRRFRIDAAALDAAYHELHAEVHPDRHAHLPDADRRRAMQWATRVNEAYSTLSMARSRACYLLELEGMDAGVHSNTAMCPEFLMEQMEWREAIEESRSAGDGAELEKLHIRLRQHARELLSGLEQALDVDRDLSGATETVRRLMFMEKLQQEIDDALEALET